MCLAAVCYDPPNVSKVKQLSGPAGVIHFGQFVRDRRVLRGWTTDELGRQTGLSGRRVIAIEAMPEPAVHQTTLARLAQAFEMEPADFDRAWRGTPVVMTPRRIRPTNDDARRFADLCSAVRITPRLALQRLRSWILRQDADTQRAVLSEPSSNEAQAGTATASETFTGLVDHIQNPAADVRRRTGRKAASEARSRGSAATGGGRRR